LEEEEHRKQKKGMNIIPTVPSFAIIVVGTAAC
jgi:hypothetical protein